jgi:hypothetical protein
MAGGNSSFPGGWMAKLRLTFVAAAAAAVIVLGGCGGGASQTPSPTATPLPTATQPPALSPTATPGITPVPAPPAVTRDWVARYRGPEGSAQWPFALTVDEDGNVYVAGKTFSDTPYDYSYATVKYDSAGKELWEARYDGPGGDDDVAQAIVLDESGNVYVTGKSCTGVHTNYAYATVKYDGNGTELWAARYEGPGEVDDDARAIAVDGSGSVYVTGSSGGDYATIKYDREGSQLWVARYDGPSGGDDQAVAVGVDAAGGVYVTGTSDGEFATLKYDSDGDQVWAARYAGAARAMALDDSGNVYVTGQSSELYATIKYDSEGNELWVLGCSGTLYGKGEAVAIALDDAGDVYITGRSYGARSSSYGYTTVKYTSGGKQRWAARYDPPRGAKVQAVDIAVDSAGGVVVTGSTWDVAWDFVTVAYDAGGREIWSDLYDGPAGGYDEAAAVAVDPWGNVYVTGRSDGGSSCADFAVIKYVPRDQVE